MAACQPTTRMPANCQPYCAFCQRFETLLRMSASSFMRRVAVVPNDLPSEQQKAEGGATVGAAAEGASKKKEKSYNEKCGLF